MMTTFSFYFKIFTTSLLSMATLLGFGIPGGVHVDSTVYYIEGLVAPYKTLHGGDTVYLKKGHRDYLLIKNLHGETGNPIVLINEGGPVVINTDHHFGISVENCTYFRFTGTGDTSILYGIRVERVANGGGVGISHQCSDFEIDHFYIADCPIGGLYAKTDPDCSFTNTREKFTQYNTVIHDNYITNVDDEGMYIGNSKYFGEKVTCNGKDTLLMPSLLKGVRIYNNFISYTGYDGIQVSSASEDCEIYGNSIFYDSQDGIISQMSGIIIGGGTSCDCYNNYITTGKGSGIEVYGIGKTRIFNNVIENPGLTFKPDDLQTMKYGIYVSDVSTVAGNPFTIIFNDIINPKSDGIRFISLLSRNNLIASNAIINPGNFDYYENGHFGSFKGVDSYIMIPDKNADVEIKNNFCARSLAEAGFFPDTYTLNTGSPLIDAGHSGNNIAFDFHRRPRPYGAGYDIGAFEYNPQFLSAGDFSHNRCTRPIVRPNPVQDTFQVDFESSPGETATLWIIDLQGNTISKHQTVMTRQNIETIKVNITGQPDAFYLYRLATGAKVFTGRFLKSSRPGIH